MGGINTGRGNYGISTKRRADRTVFEQFLDELRGDGVEVNNIFNSSDVMGITEENWLIKGRTVEEVTNIASQYPTNVVVSRWIPIVPDLGTGVWVEYYPSPDWSIWR